ncbi:MAG: lipoate--protein ligase family protein, partial [Pirellulaceae bacterium]|nr:lipoate--protein ligase family protein [Pirellulaceae bacterium]
MWDHALNLLDVSHPTPEENLAYDEALLLAVENRQCRPCLRLWECSRDTVVAGSSSRVMAEVHVEACRRDGIPILRRCTGGGLVMLGRGCLVFTLVLPMSSGQRMRGVKAATCAILERNCSVLKAISPDIAVRGTSDLAIGDRKVSGNSQRWLRRTLLHHGTLLYNFSINRVSRYLNFPERQPDYRRGRDHDSFLTNLPA